MKYSIKNSFCSACKLYKNSINPCVMGRGNINAPILLISEMITKEEDIQKKPLVDLYGGLLQYRLDMAGIDCFITSAVRCRTDGLKVPSTTAIACCKAFTVDLIKKMKPKVVVTLGKVPFSQLLKSGLSVEIARGKVFYHPDLDVYVVPTYHPTMLQKPNKPADTKYAIEFSHDLDLAREYSLKLPTRRIKAEPRTLSDPMQIKKYLSFLLTVDAVVIDLETNSVDPRTGRITDISFCAAVGEGVHIEWSKVLEFSDLLRQLLLSTKIVKVFHNASFDVGFLRACSFLVAMPVFDTMLAYHTLTMSFEGGQGSSLYGLKVLAWMFSTEGGYEGVLEEFGGIKGVQIDNVDITKKEVVTQLPLITDQEINDSAKYDNELEISLKESFVHIDLNRKQRLAKTMLDAKQYYSAMDSDVTYRLYRSLKYQIDKDFSEVFYSIVMPLCLVLVRIHENGVKIDVEYLTTLLKENEKRAEKIKKDFFKKIGIEFNINSNDMLRKFIYGTKKEEGDLGIPINPKYKTTKGKKPSTDEEALTEFSKKHPVLKNILEYRGIVKESSTYIEGYKNLADDKNRVYPNYLQIGTASGRLSARNPNLQNIPRDNRIRGMVIPSEGNKLILTDLSQVELRVLAMIAGDTAMIKAFESGHDFHTFTACKMFNIPIETFDKKNKVHNDKRSAAKTINFGMVYQQRPETLAESLGIRLSEAKDFMNKFFTSYPKVNAWIKYIKTFAHQHGYIETLYGRRRYLPNIKSSDAFIREAAERQAVNCIDDQTEVLTERGWLKYNELKHNDVILTKNMNSGHLEWQQVEAISVFPDYEGEVIEFSSKSFSAVTTPNHRWLVDINYKGNVSETTSSKISLCGHHKIHRTGIYHKEDKIYSDDFVRLVGWVLTDGYFKKSKSYTTSGIGVCQSLRAKPQNVKLIDKLFKRLAIKTSRRVQSWSKCVYWEFFKDTAITIRKLFPEKKLTYSFLLTLSSKQLLILLDTMLKGDGTVEYRGTGKKRYASKIVFYTEHEDVAKVMQMLGVLCGKATTYRWRNSLDRPYTSLKLKQPIVNSTGVWVVTFLLRQFVQVVKKQKKIHNTKILMWCPTVKNSFFVARRLTTVYITGNTPIQSCAGDICFLGLIRIQEMLDKEKLKSKIVGTIHDSIMLDVPFDEVPLIAEQVPILMTTNIPKITIDLKADVDILDKWVKE